MALPYRILLLILVVLGPRLPLTFQFQVGCQVLDGKVGVTTNHKLLQCVINELELLLFFGQVDGFRSQGGSTSKQTEINRTTKGGKEKKNMISV